MIKSTITKNLIELMYVLWHTNSLWIDIAYGDAYMQIVFAI